MKVETWSIDKPVAYARNPRKIPDAAIDKVAASIKEYGFRQPIVVDGEGVIVAGHTRLQAAKRLGLKDVPVHVAAELTPAQVKAYRLADNRSGQEAAWDNDLLALEFGDLGDMDFDLGLTAFDDLEIGAVMARAAIGEGLTDEDAVPDVPEAPITQPGDVWAVGGHRLLCGDSTDADTVAKLMNGQKADCVFTSPPYNADAKTGDGDIFGPRKSIAMYAAGFEDNKSSEEYIEFASAVLDLCFQHTDGFIFWNVNYNAKSKNEYIKQIFNRVDYLIEQVAWKKSSAIPFKGMMRRAWEPIFVFSTNKQNLSLKEVVSNFWEIGNTNSQESNHKACFPVGLPRKAINLVNVNTGIVYDPFMGSGTSIIAAETTGRVSYGIELNPAYCDVAVKRWQEFTGKEARLDPDGGSFEEIAGQRQKAAGEE